MEPAHLSNYSVFYYQNAFDLLDHRILVERINRLPFQKELVCWTFDFLMEWGNVLFYWGQLYEWNYVDDTTLFKA